MTSPTGPTIAIACGGTGGHLFPGLAVAEPLLCRGCPVTLLVSPKEVDQHAVRTASGMEIITLPAVGLSRGHRLEFIRGFIRSYRIARNHFKLQPPRAALAMGGFTSAPPVLAAKRLRAQTFVHESNIIPGRANRWLSRVVDQVFVGFPQTAARLRPRIVTITGTPVRSQFQRRDPAACRSALGLDPTLPVLLVMGGSQGARGINELVMKTLPLLADNRPPWQLLHLAGAKDVEKIRRVCAASGIKAVVHSFLSDMDLALGAATAAVSRAGASSLAELAAMRLPAVLVPYPAATDEHQLHNARAYCQTGAARLLEEKTAAPEDLARLIRELIGNDTARNRMQDGLAKWHIPEAAGHIAELMLGAIARSADRRAPAVPGQVEPGRQDRPRPGAGERQNLSTA